MSVYTVEIDETFDQIESGASQTYPTQVGSLKKGDYVMLKGKPCKVPQYYWHFVFYETHV